jgi:hypothetical protein
MSQIQLFTSLLRLAGHALQRTRPPRPGCNPTPLWAGSLSLSRQARYG